jgi:hypothetical protein
MKTISTFLAVMFFGIVYTQQQTTIFLNQKVEKGSIRVYNLQGNEVLQTNLQSTLYCVLDFESLHNGVYFVVLTDENNTKLAETKITVSI